MKSFCSDCGASILPPWYPDKEISDLQDTEKEEDMKPYIAQNFMIMKGLHGDKMIISYKNKLSVIVYISYEIKASMNQTDFPLTRQKYILQKNVRNILPLTMEFQLAAGGLF